MAVAFQHRQGAVFIAPEAECRGLDPAMFFPETLVWRLLWSTTSRGFGAG